MQEEGWVVCRAFKKPIPNERPGVFEAYTPNGVQRHGCTPDNVIPLIPNQDFYFQQSIVSGALQDEISKEGQGLPQLLDIPTPTAISNSRSMDQVLTSHHQRLDFPYFGDYDLDGEWKALNSLLSAPEPNSSCINADHRASHPLSPHQELAPPAHLDQGYYPVLHF